MQKKNTNELTHLLYAHTASWQPTFNSGASSSGPRKPTYQLDAPNEPRWSDGWSRRARVLLVLPQRYILVYIPNDSGAAHPHQFHVHDSRVWPRICDACIIRRNQWHLGFGERLTILRAVCDDGSLNVAEWRRSSVELFTGYFGMNYTIGKSKNIYIRALYILRVLKAYLK